jgi:hypothetical protein
MIVKNSAVLHAPPGYLTCDNLRSDSEAHLSPESEIITANNSALLNRLQPATSIRRFNQLWNRYETLAGYCRQLLVLASIRLPRLVGRAAPSETHAAFVQAYLKRIRAMIDVQVSGAG